MQPGLWLDGPIQCRYEGIPLVRAQQEVTLVRKALFRLCAGAPDNKVRQALASFRRGTPY
jgi:hypothetical protein